MIRQSIRSVETHLGTIEYTLLLKRVKNINFKVSSEGMLRVSAPLGVSGNEADGFVREKAEWFFKARSRILNRTQLVKQPCTRTDEECLIFFEEISDRVYPAFTEVLSQKPAIKVKEMKSRWGVCYPAKKLIILNKRLLDMPPEAAEYVVVHEYAHFIHPNHQKGFHSLMEKLMPDYKKRRDLLKG